MPQACSHECTISLRDTNSPRLFYIIKLCFISCGVISSQIDVNGQFADFFHEFHSLESPFGIHSKIITGF